MKLATLAMIAAVVIPTAALADSSQPNSAPGLEGQPVTTQGEGTTGMNRNAYPGTRDSGMMQRNGGTTGAVKSGPVGTTGEGGSSTMGTTNSNEPRR